MYMFVMGSMKSCLRTIQGIKDMHLRHKALSFFFLEPLSQLLKALFTMPHSFDHVLIDWCSPFFSGSTQSSTRYHKH